jgi:PIN domain nuclease of toxin-antitoxin system
LPVKYLLDTGVWLWLIESPEKLSDRVRTIVNDIGNAPFALSAISPWEVAKKNALGKLTLAMPIRAWLDRALRPPFMELVPLTPSIVVESTILPGTFHHDPADQIIVATARVENLTLLTKDRLILNYLHVRSLW